MADNTKPQYKKELYNFIEYVMLRNRASCLIESVINPELIETFLNQYDKQNTRAKKAAIIRTFLSVVDEELGTAYLGELKGVLKIVWDRSYIPKTFTQEQITEIVGLAQMMNNGYRNRAIIWCFLGSGIWLSELVNLKIRDISVDKKSIFVTAKGNKEKERTIDPYALSIIMDYIDFTYSYIKTVLSEEEYKELYIFSSENGKKPLNRRTIQYLITDLITKAKSIPDEEKEGYGADTFRYCFATYSPDSGIVVKSLEDIIGRESVGTNLILLKQLVNNFKENVDHF